MIKNFDLLKITRNTKIVTRDGRSARLICFDVKGERPIAVLVRYDDRELTEYTYLNGRIFTDRKDNRDLFIEDNTFDIHLALGKAPVCVKDGRSVRIIYCCNAMVVGLIFQEREVSTWNLEGKSYTNNPDLDLMME